MVIRSGGWHVMLVVQMKDVSMAKVMKSLNNLSEHVNNQSMH